MTKKMDAAAQMQIVQDMFKDDKDMLKAMKEMQDQEDKKGMEEFDKMLDEATAEYEKDMETFNKAGFAVLDANQDGKLVKQEVIDCLLFQTEKNSKFLDAFPTGPGVVAKKQFDAAMAAFQEALKQMEAATAALKAEVEPNMPFKATVQKISGKTGLDISRWRYDPRCMRVSSVTPGGPADKWNKENPESAIQVDDDIIEVNGSKGDYNGLKEEAKKANTLEFTVRRGKVATVTRVDYEGYCDKSGVDLVIPDWYHKPGTYNDLCPKYYQELEEAERDKWIKIDEGAKFGGDIAGYELKREVPVIPFKVTVEKGASGMGLDVDKWPEDPRCLRVTAVTPGGPLDKWNTKNPESAIQVNDDIIEVNGSEGDYNDLKQKIKKAKTVELTVVRRW